MSYTWECKVRGRWLPIYESFQAQVDKAFADGVDEIAINGKDSRGKAIVFQFNFANMTQKDLSSDIVVAIKRTRNSKPPDPVPDVVEGHWERRVGTRYPMKFSSIPGST
mmetsp:Transcript_41890/g.112196  ORF Transcript_41890/g.112196 Transcript_41890/m.112196 type:complete len:109 (+) Transcript_41890:49-375(+)